MASHFKWYPSSSEVIVPWNARYSFPSQANKSVKMTPRIPPKNASVFSPGGQIRLEFPAQGYVNPGNTTLEFDVTMLYDPRASTTVPTSYADYSQIQFQNNIQSLFSRVRLLYGSTPIEDIIGYNVIVRSLTEWTGTNQDGSADQTCINEGIGGTIFGTLGGNHIADTNLGVFGSQHVRRSIIQGYDLSTATSPTTTDVKPVGGDGGGVVPNGTDVTSGAVLNHDMVKKINPVRRYQVQLALGLFNQEKLIPTKFMASQLAIEITLAPAAECILASITVDTNPTGLLPTYQLSNVNLIPEILEFDASYDESFIRGLMDGGVPIKFATWNNYRFNTGGATNVNLQIQERSRSVKAIFCMLRRDPATISSDSGASFFNSNSTTIGNTSSTFNEYQFRIGGRYFPAQPVQNSTQVGGSLSNGGCESWVELSKALNVLGDYRLSSNCNALRWAINPGKAILFRAATVANNITTDALTVLPEFDYKYALGGYLSNGAPILKEVTTSVKDAGNAFAGNMGSSCFAMAIDLETSSGAEISGLNAEEQSDISLIARYSSAQEQSFVFDVYTYIDSMIVLRENNVLELIQ